MEIVQFSSEYGFGQSFAGVFVSLKKGEAFQIIINLSDYQKKWVGRPETGDRGPKTEIRGTKQEVGCWVWDVRSE